MHIHVESESALARQCRIGLGSLHSIIGSEAFGPARLPEGFRYDAVIGTGPVTREEGSGIARGP